MSQTEPVNSNAVWALDPGVRYRRMFDEAVLIHQEKAEALVLNETAVSFLELCDGKNTLEQITQILLDRYQTSHAQLAADLSGFLAELQESSIIHPVTDSDS